MSLRDALGELLWRRADSLPVAGPDGAAARPRHARGRAAPRRAAARERRASASAGLPALGRRVAGARASRCCWCSSARRASPRPSSGPSPRTAQPAIYDQGSLVALTLDHIALVAGSTAVSAAVAVLLGVLVTRPAGRDFLPLSRTLVNVGQVFPPVAVLAIAVPLVGFGLEPTLIALVLYGLLPIFENTVAGLDGVPAPVTEAARGMGLGARRRFSPWSCRWRRRPSWPASASRP